MPVTTDAPSTYPDSVPNSSQEPMKPRRLSGEYSAMNVVAPPYSPPVEKPCTMRATTSRIGDQTPMLAYEGIRPMQSVPIAIMIMVTARTFCRPMRSPSGPKTRPPRGRMRKAAVNAPKVPISRTPGDTVGGKNTSAMVSAM